MINGELIEKKSFDTEKDALQLARFLIILIKLFEIQIYVECGNNL